MKYVLPVLVAIACVGLQGMEPVAKRLKIDSASSSQEQPPRVSSLQEMAKKTIFAGFISCVDDDDFKTLEENGKNLVGHAAALKSEALSNEVIKELFKQIIEHGEKNNKHDFVTDVRMNLATIFQNNKELGREIFKEDQVRKQSQATGFIVKLLHDRISDDIGCNELDYSDERFPNVPMCEASIFNEMAKFCSADPVKYAWLVEAAKELKLHPFKIVAIWNENNDDLWEGEGFQIQGAMRVLGQNCTNLKIINFVKTLITNPGSLGMQGPDCKSVDARGRTLLNYALYFGTGIDFFKYLVEEVGMNTCILDENEDTLLHCAIESEEPIEIIKYLVENVGINPLLKNKYKSTALDMAKEINSRDKMFKSHGNIDDEVIDYLKNAEQMWQAKEAAKK